MGRRIYQCRIRIAASFTRLFVAGLPGFFSWRPIFRRHHGSIREHPAGNGMASSFKLANGVEWNCDIRKKLKKISSTRTAIANTGSCCSFIPSCQTAHFSKKRLGTRILLKGEEIGDAQKCAIKKTNIFKS